MEMPKIKQVRINAYSITCPYCGKELESVYLTQINNSYKIHAINCIKNPNKIENLNLNKEVKNGNARIT